MPKKLVSFTFSIINWWFEFKASFKESSIFLINLLNISLTSFFLLLIILLNPIWLDGNLLITN